MEAWRPGGDRAEGNKEVQDPCSPWEHDDLVAMPEVRLASTNQKDQLEESCYKVPACIELATELLCCHRAKPLEGIPEKQGVVEQGHRQAEMVGYTQRPAFRGSTDVSVCMVLPITLGAAAI